MVHGQFNHSIGRYHSNHNHNRCDRYTHKFSNVPLSEHDSSALASNTAKSKEVTRLINHISYNNCLISYQ